MFNIFSPSARIRSHAGKQLEKYSSPSKDFFTLIILSSAIVSLGLILNNSAIIIGGMLVAPLITPIFGFSLNILILRFRELGKPLLSILLGTMSAVIISALIGYLANFIDGSSLKATNEIISRVQPDIFYFLVAFFSGLAGSYAYVSEKISASVTGIAISVALIPPLAVAGLSIAMQNWNHLESSLILYLLNLIGIFFGSIIMFIILGFGQDIEN